VERREAEPENKNPAGPIASAGFSHPGLLANCFTWLQAGRLKLTTTSACDLAIESRNVKKPIAP
jgi:hypothetical protein